MVQLLCLALNAIKDMGNGPDFSMSSLSPVFSFMWLSHIRNLGFPPLGLTKSYSSSKANLQWLIFHEEFPDCFNSWWFFFLWFIGSIFSDYSSAIHQLPLLLLCALLLLLFNCHFHELLKQVCVTWATKTRGAGQRVWEFLGLSTSMNWVSCPWQGLLLSMHWLIA